MALRVALLWHMHQPHYCDSVAGVALMPWVRLHATKGYLDMIWLVEQYPDFRCSFNLTPVLLKQIELLAEEKVRDVWLELVTTPARELSVEQKCALLQHYFKANWDHMIKPHPRYWSLLQKRGTNLQGVDLVRMAGNFSEPEWRDLQVWFHLTWFGYAAQRLYPQLVELKQKGRDFTEEDKQTVLATQKDVLRTVMGRYKAAMERGQIEITTTPFYHPILPLLCDSENARRCMPGCRLPPKFAHPEDALAQLTLARDYHAKLFGAPPRGLWPSEGSVCPELVPMLKELGFEWFATDEEILWRSLANGESPDRQMLYQGFRIEHRDASVCAAFRDRALSDFIGFTAARNPPAQAAEMFLREVERIASEVAAGGVSGDDAPLCTVVLDGENAWEHFADGGEMFLRALYQRLSADPGIKTTTFASHFAKHPPKTTVRSLYTGSWINADFHIWIGDQEDNRAWELIGQTRDFLEAQEKRNPLPPATHRKAWNEIYAAEGSDWFWWYGDQFVTEDDVLFDELFRIHLKNVYRILGVPVPDALKAHICRSESHAETRRPTDLITPVIDGKVTSFYEWSGAGLYEPGRAMSAMYRSQRYIEAIYFGFDLVCFYLRVDFRGQIELPKNASLRVSVLQPEVKVISVTPLRSGECHLDCAGGTCAFEQVLELQIPFVKLGWKSGEQVALTVTLIEGQVEHERHPELGVLALTVPDERFDLQHWQV